MRCLGLLLHPAIRSAAAMHARPWRVSCMSQCSTAVQPLWVPQFATGAHAAHHTLLSHHALHPPRRRSMLQYPLDTLKIPTLCTSRSCHTRPPRAMSNTQESHPLAAVPTQLTICRVLAIPGLVAAWYLGGAWAAPACCALFIAAALTDYLDGFLARKLNATSAFGAFLDPVADKLMVATVLILLSSQPIAAGTLAGNTWLLPIATIAIISREITMSAIREWAATLGDAARSAAAVNWVGKWKTAAQMASLTLLLYARGGGAEVAVVADVGCGLLAVATGLTVVSLMQYIRAVARFFK